MKNIKKYLRKTIDSKELTIEQKNIVLELASFYEGREVEDLQKLDDKRLLVKTILDISFYKELKTKIEIYKFNETLKRKENLLKVIKILLFNNFSYFKELEDATGIKTIELKKMLSSKKLLLEFDEEIYLEVGKKILELEENEKIRNRRFENLKLYDEFIDFYLNSRCRVGDVGCFTRNFYNGFLKDLKENDYADYYPVDILERLSAKGDELSRFQYRNFVVVRDKKLVEIVKKDIIKVTSYEHKILELVVEYFSFFGNVEKMVRESENNLSYNSILSALMTPHLGNILNDDSYSKLLRYLEIEKQYQYISYKSRLESVTNIVNEFLFEYNGNLFGLIEKYGNEELVLRLLNDKLVKKCFDGHGEQIESKIREALANYENKKYVIETLKKVKTPKIESI